MTTLNPPFPRTLGSIGQHFGRRTLTVFASTLLVAMAVVSVAATAYGALHAGRVFPGVTVAGVAVGGLDRAAAEEQLRRTLPPMDDGRLIVRVGATEQSIGYDELGRDYDMPRMLDAAFAVGRAGGALTQAGQQLRTLVGGATVDTTVKFDAAELD